MISDAQIAAVAEVFPGSLRTHALLLAATRPQPFEARSIADVFADIDATFARMDRALDEAAEIVRELKESHCG